LDALSAGIDCLFMRSPCVFFGDLISTEVGHAGKEVKATALTNVQAP